MLQNFFVELLGIGLLLLLLLLLLGSYYCYWVLGIGFLNFCYCYWVLGIVHYWVLLHVYSGRITQAGTMHVIYRGRPSRNVEID